VLKFSHLNPKLEVETFSLIEFTAIAMPTDNRHKSLLSKLAFDGHRHISVVSSVFYF
jgi:hypothetical protein